MITIVGRLVKPKEGLRMKAEDGKDLDTLLKFLNARIESMERKGLEDLLQELAAFHTVEGTQPRLLEFGRHYERLAGRLALESSQDAVQERKKFLSQLQAHAQSRLEGIISAAESQKEGAALEIPGTVRVVVENGRFLVKVKKELQKTDPLEEEKFRFDARLVELFQQLDLKPSRFRKCVRCGNYFYQESEKKRFYCSIKCSAAVRQGKYLASRKRNKKPVPKRRKK
jgi:hypothetical protein